MNLYISQHPSGGFTLDIPVNQTMVIHLFDQFKVWSNNPSRKLHVQMEFAKPPFDGDIDFFGHWVKTTALVGRVVSEDNLNILRE